MDGFKLFIDAFTPRLDLIAMYWADILVFMGCLIFVSFVLPFCLSRLIHALVDAIQGFLQQSAQTSAYRVEGKVSKTSLPGLRNRELQAELLTLLHWDYPAATRILRLLQLRYPGRSRSWYLEKAIADLLRDRHR